MALEAIHAPVTREFIPSFRCYVSCAFISESVHLSIHPLRLFIFGCIDVLISTAWPVLTLIKKRAGQVETFPQNVQLLVLPWLSSQAADNMDIWSCCCNEELSEQEKRLP